jgi:DNA-nicking Smr family endonuclease
MAREPTAEERELWERVRRSVRPLRPFRFEPAPRPAEAEPAPQATTQPPPPPPATASVVRPPSPPPLAPLPSRERLRLSRGQSQVDARIDLHGMRQETAFHALIGFLRQAQARGDRVALVITGKGRSSEETGALRRLVPEWLARPEFRALVLGLEEASRRHGGGGALYVRLRRRRQGGS